MSESADPALVPAGEPVSVEVENVGGIEHCAVEFDPGVTVLTGRNATNRTSLLSAVAGALGGSAATLKSDAEEGRVELRVGEQRYTRRYARRSGTVRVSGEPYRDDGDLVDLFACLLADNPGRRAVESGDDLREYIMAPVDRERIRAEIRDLETERDRIERRLSEIERRRETLPKLEERRSELADEIEAVQAEIEAVQAEIDEYDADEAEAEEAERLVSRLQDRRDEQRRVEDEIEVQESTLADLRERRAAAETELDDLTVDEAKLDEVQRDLDRLQGRRRALSDTIHDLTAIVGFNEDVASGTIDLPGTDDGGSVTEALDPSSERIDCWTCGSSVVRGDVEERLAELRDLADEKREARKRVEAEIEELEARRDELRSTVEHRDDLAEELEEIDREIERREDRVAELRDDAEQVAADVADLEERIAETEALRESDLVEKHDRLNDLQYERGQLEQERADVADEIEELAAMADERERLRDERESVREELAAARSRIDDLERGAVEQFNEHMDEVLDLLAYRNVARVWIERTETGPGGEGSTFELHVVRESADGAVYEDVVDNLSESEREVIGLVVALAGYLVHDVHEAVPVMLLDSLEAIDADRIARLVAYFADHVPFLLVALLPEDAQALPGEYDRLPAEALAD